MQQKSILPISLAKKELVKLFNFFDTNSNLLKDDDGTMFGVLVCKDKNNKTIILKAFSGQLNKKYIVEGFVPPLFDVYEYEKIIKKYDSLIKSKKENKTLSNKVLRKIYDLYKIPTIDNKILTFKDIFKDNLPPTGTGDCCAPKLLGYAFNNNLHPISIAEAYYGKETEKRKHKSFYGPCSEKCEILLEKMLKLNIVYCDDYITVINKPFGITTIPGKAEHLKDCITSRMNLLFKDCIKQSSVHRLDMDTSGLLVLCRDKISHRNLSISFQERKVKKEYLALIRGIVKDTDGVIRLPLRLDINNRPYQIVDFAEGKKSITYYKRIKVEKRNKEDVTRLILTPITGRTHQLRVHCQKALFPIIGDTLYGIRKENENRMMLQAIRLEFDHPITNEHLCFELNQDF